MNFPQQYTLTAWTRPAEIWYLTFSTTDQDTPLINNLGTTHRSAEPSAKHN